jgi:cytochrome c oxidase subunit II
MSRPATRTRRYRRFALVTLVVAVLSAACSSGSPQGVTVQGKDTRNLFLIILIMAIAVFVLVDGAILWMVLRYRRRPGDDELPPQIHGNSFVEVLWTVLPTILVVVIFTLSLRTLHRVQATAANPTVSIEVGGFQWQWNFKYPDDGFTVRGKISQPPEMVVPVNESIRITEKSNDVIHSFYVPSFLFKKDVIPGVVNEFQFKATTLGTFGGQCAEFCGLLHNKMTFTVRVVERPEYEAWILDQQRKEQQRKAQCGQATDQVTVVANNISFPRDCFTIKADSPYTISFDNEDSGIAHNVQIYKDEGFTIRVTNNPIFPGVATHNYQGAPLTAGAYKFRCDVHPGSMQGDIIVQ